MLLADPARRGRKAKERICDPHGPLSIYCNAVRYGKVLDGLHLFAQCFIDDIGIYSETWGDHLEHLRVVFQRLRDAKLSAKPSKCCFGFD